MFNYVLIFTLVTLSIFSTIATSARPALSAADQTGCGVESQRPNGIENLGVPRGGAQKTGWMPSRTDFTEAVSMWQLEAPGVDSFQAFTDPVFDYNNMWIWFLADDIRLIALDPMTGESTFEYESAERITEGPILNDGSVILGYMDGGIASFNAKTGGGEWTIGAPGEIHGDLIATDDSVISISGSIQGTEQVFALDPDTGDFKWAVDALTRDGYPLQGVRSLSAGDGVVVAVGIGGLMAVDEETGRWCWGTSYWTTYGESAIYEGAIIAANGETGKLAARDVNDGELLWEANAEMGLGSPAAGGGAVAFGSRDGSFYVVGARSGEPRWQYEAGDFSYSNPVIANQTILAPSKDGMLYAFDLTTGAVKWTYPIGGAEYGHTNPLVMLDVIYVGSDEALHALWGQ